MINYTTPTISLTVEDIDLNTIKLKSGNVLSYYVNTSSYGLHPNITYRYIITYSS